MAENELETQRAAASYGRSPFRPGQPRPSVVVPGFEHEVMYPGHNHGTDGRMHVPAEAFTEHSVRDAVEVSIATDSLDVLSLRVQRLVDFANSDIARGDLVVPQIDGATQAENLTAYLKAVIDQQTREVARRLLRESNEREEVGKTMIKDIIDTVAGYNPELAFILSDKYEKGTQLPIMTPEVVSEMALGAETHERTPTTMDRIMTNPAVRGFMRTIGFGKFIDANPDLQKAS